MKRLRLRKIWVVLAVLALLTPLLGGSMERTEATATAPSDQGTSEELPSQDFAIKFGVSTGTIDDDGITVGEFKFETIEHRNEFDTYLPTVVTATLYVGDEPMDEQIWGQYYDIEWLCSATGDEGSYVPISEFSRNTDVIGLSVSPIDESLVKKNLIATAKGAGVNFVYFRVNLINKNDDSDPIKIPRTLSLKVPLQIYHNNNSAYESFAIMDPNDSIEDIVTNKTESATIFWYYYDASTDEYVKLEDVNAVNISDIKSRTSSLISKIEYVKKNGENRYSYTISSNEYGGTSRIIGRIFLNNNSEVTDSKRYVEQSFEVFINPTAPKDEYILEYGDELRFSDISNDIGNSLEWYLDGHGTKGDRQMPYVVELINNPGKVVGKYYGIETLFLTPIARYVGKDYWNTNLDDRVSEKKITFKTEFNILKGEVEKYREKAEDIEVIDVKGSITLSTNMKPSATEYTYIWEYAEGINGTLFKNMISSTSSYFSCTQGTVTGTGDYSSIKLTGEEAGTVKIRCTVKKKNDIIGEHIITVKIVDSLILSDNIRTVEVGNSFIINASSSSSATITWTSEDEEYVTVHPVGNSSGDAVGPTMEVTGVKVTGDDYITITATQANGRTATCSVKVVDALSPVRIEGDTILTTKSGGALELIFEGNTPHYSSDDISWIVKDKGNLDADTLIKVQQDSFYPTKATVNSFEVTGEAYVAVVLNEVRDGNQVQTELAVVTIKVVSSPKRLTLNVPEDGVIGYLDEGSYDLVATIEPEGYTDGEGLEIEWISEGESIIKPEVTNEDGTRATIHYVGPGETTITAHIKGTPITATVKFTIRERVKGIALEPEDGLVLKEGMTGQLEATVTPENATNKTLTWTSMNPAIATVDDKGQVTAVKAGTTSIVVKSVDGAEAVCPVTVLVATDEIILNYTDITVKKNTIFYLSAQVLPVQAYDKEVIYSSDDEKVVTVEQDGTVTAVGVGVAEITVTSVDNPEVTAVCRVTVVEAVAGLTLSSREITIDVGEQYLLKATVHPSDATNLAVTFQSSDPSIATVDENGLITGVKGGTTVIIVKTVERGLMASCTVTVQEDITSITLSETETYLAKGGNKKITATILPASATKKKLLWTSSDESIVIVDSEGNIHGVNLGTAIITATAQDDGKVSATCKVTVVDATTKITLNQSIIRIMQTDTYQLTYTIEPSYATVKRVNWSTSDASVARVDSLGLVTGIGEGEAKIRATAADGSGVYAECTVIVTPAIPTTSVRVDTTSTTMVVGDTRTMTARVMPRNTTEGIRWVSEDTSVVTIDNNGNIRAVGPGVAQVTAISSVGGVEGSATITVLGLNASAVTLEQYDTFDLYLDGVTSGVTWFSRNKRVATVSRKGVVTGRKEGTTEVVARVNGKLVSCEVNVEKLKK